MWSRRRESRARGRRTGTVRSLGTNRYRAGVRCVPRFTDSLLDRLEHHYCGPRSATVGRTPCAAPTECVSLPSYSASAHQVQIPSTPRRNRFGGGQHPRLLDYTFVSKVCHLNQMSPPRHLPEVAWRIPRQGSKGNGDSGRLVQRTRAGEHTFVA